MKKEEKKIKLLIQNYQDREAMVIALTHAGYKTWVEEERIRNSLSRNYYVLFELNDPSNL